VKKDKGYSMIIENEYVWRALDELETSAMVLIDTKGVISGINKGVT